MTSYLIKGQFAGADAGHAVRATVVSLRKALAAIESTRHSEDILSVSGELDTFDEPNGCSHYRVMTKARRAAVDLTMHRDVWTEGETAVRGFLRDCLHEATHELCARIEERGLRLDNSSLLADLKRALDGWCP